MEKRKKKYVNKMFPANVENIESLKIILVKTAYIFRQMQPIQSWSNVVEFVSFNRRHIVHKTERKKQTYFDLHNDFLHELKCIIKF